MVDVPKAWKPLNKIALEQVSLMTESVLDLSGMTAELIKDKVVLYQGLCPKELGYANLHIDRDRVDEVLTQSSMRSLTAEDLKVMNEVLSSEIPKLQDQIGNKILEWNDGVLIQVAEVNMFEIQYVRQSKVEPFPVRVFYYIIWTDGVQLSLRFSFRDDHKTIWLPIQKRIINSIRLVTN